MPSFIADFVFPVSDKPIPEGILETSNDGTIIACIAPDEPNYNPSNATRLSGWLVPGFVNCHVHVELSHLLNTIPKKIGLNAFLENLSAIQPTSEYSKQIAIKQALDEMHHSGTIAALDISNTASSFKAKSESAIDFLTAVEVFGFDPEKADTILTSADQILKLLPNGKGIIAPHAPYSVSAPLWQGIRERLNQALFPLLTIHSQESQSELEFFMNGSGEIPNRFRRMGIKFDHFTPNGKSSIDYISDFFEKNWRILLVHNTFTEADELTTLVKKVKDLYICLCPSANLYIEGKLPNVPAFLHTNIPITIGTDSLASNENLKMLKELVILQTNFPEIDSEQLIRFATLNGARLLNKEHMYGSFEVGKKPGIVLIEHLQNDSMLLTAGASARRII